MSVIAFTYSSVAAVRSRRCGDTNCPSVRAEQSFNTSQLMAWYRMVRDYPPRQENQATLVDATCPWAKQGDPVANWLVSLCGVISYRVFCGNEMQCKRSPSVVKVLIMPRLTAIVNGRSRVIFERRTMKDQPHRQHHPGKMEPRACRIRTRFFGGGRLNLLLSFERFIE